MAATLAHRGPDDAGEWIDAGAGVALGFRRLSIVDLSAAGHQPMLSASGRYVAALNGEIYNHHELRRALIAEGTAPPFRGHSDTELMLAAIDAWGLTRAIPRFNGMWAIALWDTTDRTLTLVRDRMGVKPLYYGFAGQTLLFGSELKALAAHPSFAAPLDRAAIPKLLRVTYIPAPRPI
jgi:asparagine synthase (glutamine-hydrolysing)